MSDGWRNTALCLDDFVDVVVVFFYSSQFVVLINNLCSQQHYLAQSNCYWIVFKVSQFKATEDLKKKRKIKGEHSQVKLDEKRLFDFE